MSYTKDEFLADLLPFADIGAGSIKFTSKPGLLSATMLRNGEQLRVTLDESSGAARTKQGSGAERGHASFAAMLASESFANLRKWADTQRELLRSLPSGSQIIPLGVTTSTGQVIGSIDGIDTFIAEARSSTGGTLAAVVIDGPAGIGKTTLIEQLASRRASTYRESATPLLLHVKSRGRVLSNLQDLMAFSLQTIRASVTYDQVPVLCKHGLIVIAIDGFDELGDPNGYETAWSQLGDLVNAVRGRGTIVLAGRDTFIGHESVLRDVHAFKASDIVLGLRLDLPSPTVAKEWLESNRWRQEDFEIAAVRALLEEGSFALRPVVLRLLASLKPKELKGKSDTFLTSMLVNHMVAREARLFGKVVESLMSLEDIENFLVLFLREVAREMADSQTEALDAASLSWIAETVLGDNFPANILGLIKNRAGVNAFLIADERPGYRTFVHSQLMNFFLAHVAVDTLARREYPKFFRRNLLTSDFLSVYVDVAAQRAAHEDFQSFVRASLEFGSLRNHMDRSGRNAGALLLSTLPFWPQSIEGVIDGFQVDEAVLRSTSSPCVVRNSFINQLDARGADLSAVIFSDVTVLRLIGDEGTRVPLTFPTPSVITSTNGDQLSEMAGIDQWLSAHGRSSTSAPSSVVPERLKAHQVYKLLGRICRLRQYWLRAEDDPIVERLLNDQSWPALYRVLMKHGFVREETRQASGRPAPFVHVRQKDRLLAESKDDAQVALFFTDLAREVGIPS